MIILRNASASNRNKGTDARLYYQPQDSFVEGEEGRISQLICNLVNNAFKFSREPGTVTINTKLGDNSIIVSVKDTGQGTDPKILPELFSKFEAKSFSRTGLGLYISKSIIEAHGGRIWTENNNNNNILNDERGGTFYFSLPVLGIQRNQLVRERMTKAKKGD